MLLAGGRCVSGSSCSVAVGQLQQEQQIREKNTDGGKMSVWSGKNQEQVGWKLKGSWRLQEKQACSSTKVRKRR